MSYTLKEITDFIFRPIDILHYAYDNLNLMEGIETKLALHDSYDKCIGHLLLFFIDGDY